MAKPKNRIMAQPRISIEDEPVEELQTEDTVQEETVDAVTGVEDTPTNEPTPDPVPEPEVVPVVEPTPVAPVDPLLAFLQARHEGFTEENMTFLLKTIRNEMEGYLEKMGPSTPVNETIGKTAQLGLNNTIYKALGAKDGEHRIGLDIICWFINRNKHGAFSDRLRSRYVNVMKLSPQQCKVFQDLLMLLTVTADPATRRQALRGVNINGIVNNLSSHVYQRALLDYYTA